MDLRRIPREADYWAEHFPCVGWKDILRIYKGLTTEEDESLVVTVSEVCVGTIEG